MADEILSPEEFALRLNYHCTEHGDYCAAKVQQSIARLNDCAALRKVVECGRLSDCEICGDCAEEVEEAYGER